jgi:HD-GYP domain-containing protein (c-di-GMP phosphodiesterase class II)
MEHVLRQCMISLRFADALELEDKQRAVVYYSALMVNVGCHTDAHEQSKWFGDDIALRSTKYDHKQPSVRGALTMVRLLGSGNPPLHRFRVGLEFAVRGYHDLDDMIENHSALARSLAQQLGLGDDVEQAVGSSYERWDGKGWPGRLAGEEIPLAARINQLAEFVEVAHRSGGVEQALELGRDRSGAQFDPGLVSLMCERPHDIFDGVGATPSWRAVIDAEPALGIRLVGEQIDQALVAIADFVDLKSPYTLGHARAVAELCAGAGDQLGLSPAEVATLRRAGLVSSMGRLGVSNSIWDKPAPLGAGEWERVRMHPYITERMLHQSAALAPLGEIAVQYRERLDGSGYPRGLSGAAIGPAARVLAAADAYQSMLEPRAHREALAPERAASELRAEVKAGRLDATSVDAVLAAAGHRTPRRKEGPAGLTEREVDVLRLLARGLSSKQIAEQLVISTKTARNHTEHIYAKIGASNRAGASLFAVRNGLLA